MRSMNTVRDVSPMTNRMAATMIAGHPMCAHISVKLNPIALVLSPVRRRLSRHPEWNRDDLVHGDRLALVASRLELPALHRLDRGAQERLVAAHRLHVADRAVGHDDDLQHDRSRFLRRERRRRILRLLVAGRRNRRIGILRNRHPAADRAARDAAGHAALEPSDVTGLAVSPDRDALVEARIDLLGWL